MYLIDTMLLSELRRRERDPAVVAWIARQRSTDPAFAEELAAWLNRLLRLHHERLLARDLPAACRWGQLSAALGHDSADLLIAATALEHGLTVVTRNLRHFTPTGVASFNPWQAGGEA